eukprot:4436035-Prymnesium_polylepis.1
MVLTILSPLALTAHANVGGWADLGAFGACGTCVDSVTQNCDNAAHPHHHKSQMGGSCYSMEMGHDVT